MTGNEWKTCALCGKPFVRNDLKSLVCRKCGVDVNADGTNPTSQ